MPELVPQERNMEEFPFFLLNKRGRGATAEIEFERTLTVGEIELLQVWRVHCSGKIGMPGPVDQDIYVGTNVLLHRAGGLSGDGELDLSLYEIRRLLGWQVGKENYRYVREGLTRIGRTAIESRQAFYSKRGQTHLNDNINLWTSHFRNFEDVRGRYSAERHCLSFTKHYARSLADGYVSYLDVDFYFSLSRSGSKRLLRLINACATGGSRWEVEMTRLRGQVPLSAGYTAPSKIEEKLESSHDELYEAGYLSDFAFERREDGIYAIYDLNPRFVQLREDLALEANPANRPALEMMIAADIPRQVRLRELRKHGPARCYEVAELLPYQRNMQNPLAVFTRICEQGVPDWWRTVARPRIEIPDNTPGTGAEDTSGDGWDLFSADRPPKDPPKEPPAPDPAAQSIWEPTLIALAEEIDVSSLRVWFDGIVPVRIEGPLLTVVVPNTFAQEYISTRFKQLIEETLASHLGEGATLQILVNGGDQGVDAADPPTKTDKPTGKAAP